MKKNIYYLLSFYLLFSLACKKNANDDKIIDIEKEFSVQMWEQLNEQGGNFQFIISTSQNQPCGITRIDYAQNNIAGKYIITIKDLLVPPTCNGKIEPAKDSISLGNLPHGVFNININLKDVVLNEGTLTVEQGKYQLVMKKEDGLAINQKEILRVPKGAIWGYIAYDNGQESKYSKFNDNFSKMVTPLSISQGDYGYFNVKTSNTVELKSTTDTKKPHLKQIFHKLNVSQSNTDLINLVEEYRNQGLELKIYTSEGKIL